MKLIRQKRHEQKPTKIKTSSGITEVVCTAALLVESITNTRSVIAHYFCAFRFNPLKPTTGLTRSGTGCFIAVPIWQQ